MAVRPLPPIPSGPSVPGTAKAPLRASQSSHGGVNPVPPSSSSTPTKPVPVASNAYDSPTNRPLPTPPIHVPPVPAVKVTQSSPRAQQPPVNPSPIYTSPSSSPGSVRASYSPEKVQPRPTRPVMTRTPSEAMVKKANIVSAVLAKATLRSNRALYDDMSRSSSIGSISSDDSTDDVRKRLEERSSSDKELKSKDKHRDDKKDKKDDHHKASTSSAPHFSISSYSSSSSDPITSSKFRLGRQKNHEDEESPASSPFSGSLGSASSLSVGILESRKHNPLKVRKPKQYVQDNAENYGQFVDLLMRNRFSMMRALEPHVKRADLDRLSKDFTVFFTWREITLDYIKSAIRQDVDLAESEGTLFRTNTLLTAMMSNYCQRIGKAYLKSVLGPAFEWLQESTLQFEIDPAQVETPEAVKQNIFNMNYLANKFFKAILNSNDSIPFEIREIANTLQVAVLRRFPNSKYTAIGGFFFLRFVCPSVIASESVDPSFSTEATPALRRPLILVAKILQQIANDQKFNEPHMEPLNELFSKWTVKVHQFFDLLVQKDTAALHKERDRVLEQMKDVGEAERMLLDKVGPPTLFSIHKFVSDNISDLVLKFSDQEKDLGYNPAREMQDLLTEMGPLPERNKARANSASTKK